MEIKKITKDRAVKEMVCWNQQLYTINHYLGCYFGCEYCYMNQPAWSSCIKVQINAPELLENEIQDLDPSQLLSLSDATDPYQPVESTLFLTRQLLTILAATDQRVCIMTKSDLILRDVNLLKKFGDRLDIGISVSITGPESVLLEKNAPAFDRRIDVAKKLQDQGLDVWIALRPLLPKLTNVEELLKATEGEMLILWAPLSSGAKKSYRWQTMKKLIQTHWPDLINLYENIFFHGEMNDFYRTIIDIYAEHPQFVSRFDLMNKRIAEGKCVPNAEPFSF